MNYLKDFFKNELVIFLFGAIIVLMYLYMIGAGR